ncbi:MAG: hypothetical protein J6M94_07760 [Prevotella sp.]|nr:hypothetical protein [Prevotella sp.]
MKKIYQKPLMEVTELEMQAAIAAASGPGFEDSHDLPNVSDDGDDGPGAGDYGNTPTYSNSNGSNWEDEF